MTDRICFDAAATPLLDPTKDRVRASQIQKLQMEAEQLAAFALKNALALELKVEPGRSPLIVVREARDGS